MSSHKKDINDLSSQTIPSAQAELLNWEQLAFSFDMDNNDPSQENQPTNPSPQQSRSSPSASQSETLNPSNHVDDVDFFARFAAAVAAAAGSNMGHNQAFAPLTNPTPSSMPPALAFHTNPFQHSNTQHPQLPPVSSLDLAWNQFIHQYNQPSPYNAQQSVGAMSNIPPFPYVSLPNATAHQQALSIDTKGTTATPKQHSTQYMQPPTQTLALASAQSLTTDIDSAEGERSSTAEEKRRRNTEASARFRIKRKQRTINLERSVSGLTGRAEELEKEVADLRRENGWLKEIIMLKSTQFATTSMQQRVALSQVVQAAGIDLHLSSLQSNRPEASSSSGSAQKSKLSESSDDEASTEEADTDKKGKGKKPATKHKKR